MKTLQEISAADTFSVRHPVLRAGKPVESCRFDGDNLASTRHFGVFENEKLVGVASLFQKTHPFFAAENQFQLRGMAVLESHRRRGLGEDLVKFAEDHANSENADMIWFNARLVAVPFYEKLGYSTVGDAFEIGDIGSHFVMFKNLKT